MTSATLEHDEFTLGGVPGEDSLKYQLNVVASSVLDAVSASGGWLFDRVMAGWEVNVLLAEPGDIRPLSIVGARVFDLETALRPAAADSRRPEALAVSSDMFARDLRISREVVSALRRGRTEVTFWGAALPATVDTATTVVEHRLTAAAHAFKSRALAMASAPAAATRTERFFAGGVRYSGP